MAYIKKHGWIALLAIFFDFLAILYWRSFISTGSIYDGKHDITFFGESASGLLVGTSLGAFIFTYYFKKTLVQFNRD